MMPRIVLERTLKGKEKSLLDAAFPEGRLAVVFDPETYSVLAHRVLQAMPSLRVQPVALPSHPKPAVAELALLQSQASDCVAYVAVGSGTINDLCKRAAFLSEKPYVVFPTAPSMNGYVSANASFYVESCNGVLRKESVPAAPPMAVLVDLEVVAEAPLRLIRSGLGDSICRSTAQADWLLSHHLLGTPYDSRPFALLAEDEPLLFAKSMQLAKRDPDAIACLMRTLLASGEGMTLAGGSYPASQGEHMIAHTYEQLCAGGALPYHGELIAVTTLHMARRQEACLSQTVLRLRLEGEEALPPALRNDAVLAGVQKKRELWSKALTHLPERWQEARKAIYPQFLTPTRVEDVLEAAGVATSPEALGLDNEAYSLACRMAHLTRDRFTFLDLEAG